MKRLTIDNKAGLHIEEIYAGGRLTGKLIVDGRRGEICIYTVDHEADEFDANEHIVTLAWAVNDSIAWLVGHFDMMLNALPEVYAKADVVLADKAGLSSLELGSTDRLFEVIGILLGKDMPAGHAKQIMDRLRATHPYYADDHSSGLIKGGLGASGVIPLTDEQVKDMVLGVDPGKDEGSNTIMGFPVIEDDSLKHGVIKFGMPGRSKLNVIRRGDNWYANTPGGEPTEEHKRQREALEEMGQGVGYIKVFSDVVDFMSDRLIMPILNIVRDVLEFIWGEPIDWGKQEESDE